MTESNRRATYRSMSREQKERLFLDILERPKLEYSGSWGEWLHAWLEDQAAEGRPLGEIARRMDFPTYENAKFDDPWNFLDRHVGWLIETGCARVVRIEPVY